MARIKTFRLRVRGEQIIHCSGCEKAIKVSLSQLPGVKRVQADHRTQRIEVTADVEKTGLEAIWERLAWMGYGVTLG